jgi:hypothetical protein
VQEDPSLRNILRERQQERCGKQQLADGKGIPKFDPVDLVKPIPPVIFSFPWQTWVRETFAAPVIAEPFASSASVI